MNRFLQNLQSRHGVRQFCLSLVEALAALALAACGGGTAVEEMEVAQARPVAMLAQPASSVTMTKVAFSNSDGQALTGFLFRDPGAITRQAAVVMMHGCSGVWSNGVVNADPQPPKSALSHVHRRWGEQLARDGYTALLVDSFTARGLTNECGNGTAGLNEAVVRPRDALAGRQWLVDNGWVAGSRIALLGWSNGGSAVMAAMDTSNAGAPGARPFAEAFAFYPGCGLINNFGGDASTPAKTTWLPYAPVTIHHGSLDALYTDGRCANRVAGAAGLAAMTVHAGARHSFDQVDLGKPLSAPYTAQDQQAQANADAAVQARLATLFPQ
ncbi:MAG: prolyl oligopeptidase family serine peptidase [Burkholderiales bacterium]|nr:prolyl oligopeptidase family serine peptidase [Burkholderiales bacterium]